MRVRVCWATAQCQCEHELQLPDGSTIAAALAVLRSELTNVAFSDVGVFGVLRTHSTVLRDGDRVELYRPLRIDPKEARRARARRSRDA